jgi:hypothetical protein
MASISVTSSSACAVTSSTMLATASMSVSWSVWTSLR